MEVTKIKALVTGGASGIGYSIAKKLSESGAEVVICGRDKEKLRKSGEELRICAHQCDVSDENSVIKLVKLISGQMPAYNTLINNAGFARWNSIFEVSAQDMRDVWATNVLGPTLITRESVKLFRKLESSNVINVCSTAARKGFSNGSAYASSKFALAGLTECWRSELRQYNVRVIQINPSEVQTPFFDAMGKRELNPSKLVPYDIAHTVKAMLEMDDRGFIPEVTVWATNPG